MRGSSGTYVIAVFLLSLTVCSLSGCTSVGSGAGGGDDNTEQPDDAGPQTRSDGAERVEISAGGSLQNPAWSPNGRSLLLTRWVGGYNIEPADLLVVELNNGSLRTLVSDGSANVNLPGSSWNSTTNQITYSSSREPHDEIYVIPANRDGDEVRVTERADTQAFEPSFSPDGEYIVFESHPIDVEGEGVITVYRVDGSEPYRPITAAVDDCRQPNWSPAGDLILYQKLQDGHWDIWLTDPDGDDHQWLTEAPGDETDASFSPDGGWVVYSSDEHGEEGANLFAIPVDGGESVRATFFAGYDGAPSWSPDSTRIAFESYAGDPDGSPGTTIWTIAAPDETLPKSSSLTVEIPNLVRPSTNLCGE